MPDPPDWLPWANAVLLTVLLGFLFPALVVLIVVLWKAVEKKNQTTLDLLAIIKEYQRIGKGQRADTVQAVREVPAAVQQAVQQVVQQAVADVQSASESGARLRTVPPEPGGK